MEAAGKEFGVQVERGNMLELQERRLLMLMFPRSGLSVIPPRDILFEVQIKIYDLWF